jgi:hypothetical protein
MARRTLRYVEVGTIWIHRGLVHFCARTVGLS